MNLSPLVVGPRVQYSFEWKCIKPGVQRKVLHPLWGVKARLRPLVWSGMNDIGAIAKPLDWPLLRLLLASQNSRRHVRVCGVVVAPAQGLLVLTCWSSCALLCTGAGERPL